MFYKRGNGETQFLGGGESRASPAGKFSTRGRTVFPAHKLSTQGGAVWSVRAVLFHQDEPAGKPTQGAQPGVSARQPTKGTQPGVQDRGL